MASTEGSWRREAREGCSGVVPFRNFEADSVRIMRMEMFGWWWWDRDSAIRGSLIVATEPVAARRMWVLPSLVWAAAVNGVVSVIVLVKQAGYLLCLVELDSDIRVRFDMTSRYSKP